MILPAAFETEIYLSDGGFIGIKQPDSAGDQDDVVLLSPHQLPAVIEELQRLYDEETKKALGVVS